MEEINMRSIKAKIVIAILSVANIAVIIAAVSSYVSGRSLYEMEFFKI